MTFVQGTLATWPGRIFALALVAMVVGGAVIASRINAAPAKAELRTSTVTRGSVTQAVAVSGSVNTAGQVKLNFKSTGRLAEVYVSVGQQVAVGQALAKLDTTDLEIALTQAQAGMQSANAKYQQTLAGATPEDVAIAKQAVDNAQRSLEESQRTTSNDLTSAQQGLAKIDASYSAARTNFTTLSTALPNDIGAIGTTLADAKMRSTATINDIQASVRPTQEVLNARSAVLAADSAIARAQSSLSGTSQTALGDYGNARDALVAVILKFDSALRAGRDTSGISQEYQVAQVAYASAATRLAGAFDSTTAAIQDAQSSASSAQTILNGATVRTYPDLDTARADLTSLQASLSASSQQVDTVRSRITQAGNALTGVTDAISGSYASAQQNVASTQERGNSSVSSAQNSLQNAQLSLQKTSAGPKSYDIAASYASVLSAQASLLKAQNDLDSAVLKAPVTSIVAQINNQIGENVTGGTNGFMLLANVSSYALHGTVGEADVAKLKLSQVASVTVDAVGTARMTGKVTSIDPVATIQQGVPVYGVDVTIDIPNPQVRAGMSGTANVVIASKQGVLTVPNLAIRSQGGRRFVQVLKDGEAVDTDVTFGIANDTVTEVASGLEEGQTVVLPQPRAGATNRPGGFGPGPGGPVVR